MTDFYSRLIADPRKAIDAASVTRVDEVGNGYDDFGQLIAPAYVQPEQTWGETALGVATAPARLGSALLGSISPYQFPQSTSVPMNRAGAGQPITGGDPTGGGWQVPPIVSEGADALTAVGDAYTGKMAPEEIPSRALGLAGFMFAGGGPAMALERSLAQRGISSTADMIPTGVKDYGQAAYRSIRYPHETPVIGPMSDMDIWQRFGMSTREGKDLSNAPFWEEPDGTLNMLYPDGPDTYGAFSGPNRLANEPGVPGDVNAYKAKPVRPDIEVIDGGLYSNADSRPAIAGALDMSQEARLARARDMGFDTDRVLYHGTGKDFQEFEPGTRGNGTRRNVYLTDNPDIADIYANSQNYGLKGGGDPMIYPLYAKAEKPLVVSDKGPDGSFGWVSDNLAAALGVDHPPAGKYATLYDEARRQGYDQVQIREMTDLGGPQTQYIPLKPEYIRSVNAAFDPAKSDSANLLAANADSRPALLAGAMDQERLKAAIRKRMQGDQ